ncbi:hypothetical protein [Sphaerotilus sp.]|uniref:hypothetical protein n=1 Tax=Sphaerotilus sp. TaxID=2093942 RepID=UPI002ACD455B|nr:hypothetical protein [Sphaerotilus sp.]MDZ7857451.1 hypothetical protein [Sphaerotilus sp.]
MRIKHLQRLVSNSGGLHVYFKNKSNFYFPWELQIWDIQDIASNIQNHEKFKRGFSL